MIRLPLLIALFGLALLIDGLLAPSPTAPTASAQTATITLDAEHYQVEEGETLTVTVSATAAASAQTVTLSAEVTGTGAGHAESGADFAAGPWTHTIIAGASFTQQIDIKPNTALEGVESFTIRLTGSGNMMLDTATVRIVDVHTVPSDWALIPSGVSAGEKFRLLFLTAATAKASSADIDDYNTIVQNEFYRGNGIHDALISIGGLFNFFSVVGSTHAVDAIDNTGTRFTSTNRGVPVYWADGRAVANDYRDFYDGSWADNIGVSRNALADGDNALTEWYAWTGTFDSRMRFPRGTPGTQTGYELGGGEIVTMWYRDDKHTGDTAVDALAISHLDLPRRLLAISQVFKVADNSPLTLSSDTTTSQEPTPPPIVQCASDLPANAVSVAELTAWRDDPRFQHVQAHIDRWNRALKALDPAAGQGTAMTAAQAKVWSDKGWGRWVRTYATLTAIERCLAE